MLHTGQQISAQFLLYIYLPYNNRFTKHWYFTPLQEHNMAKIKDLFSDNPSLRSNEQFCAGEQYFLSQGGVDGSPKFLPGVSYNILSMACESYLCGALDAHKIMPEDHAYGLLLDYLEPILQVPLHLRKRLLTLESLQNLCDPYDKGYTADESTVEEFRAVTWELREYCIQCIQKQ
jgi:hypothetical protein